MPIGSARVEGPHRAVRADLDRELAAVGGDGDVDELAARGSVLAIRAASVFSSALVAAFLWSW